jgi:hypothetical protein
VFVHKIIVYLSTDGVGPVGIRETCINGNVTVICLGLPLSILVDFEIT